MTNKHQIIKEALRLGFDDIGFTSAEIFDSQLKILKKRREHYAWTGEAGFDLEKGADPLSCLAGAKSIIVLLANYFTGSFPHPLLGRFGRCYQDDDRMTKDGLSRKLKGFRGFLTEQGIESAVPMNLPHRLAAARAGLGDFGKNCLFYAKRVARQSSWIIPLAIVVNHEFPPDEPSPKIGCPDWCRNACLAACPTGALTGPLEIDPRRCISYLTYFGAGLTPLPLREPMGMWVYGCDRCQEVCPRNTPWLNQDLPVNVKVQAKAPAFDLTSLLRMDQEYFEKKIWPHMFYIAPADRWRWQMNAARALGNSRDERYLEDLATALKNAEHVNVRAMAAWAIGAIGGEKAADLLTQALAGSAEPVRAEIETALTKLHRLR